MSYEHCEKHDEPATNGCASCEAERRSDALRRLDNFLASWFGGSGEREDTARFLKKFAEDGFYVTDDEGRPVLQRDPPELERTMTMEFKECPQCAAQSGMPVLCDACIHNRDLIRRLGEIGRRLWCLLDDISTAGDVFKPKIGAYFRAVNRTADERGKYGSSDGSRVTLRVELESSQ